MSDSPLKVRLQEDMKNAMRAKDAKRLSVVRLMLAALKQREVDERILLKDDDILQILNKMVKQRRDSVEQFQKANRQDLVEQEEYELTVIAEYMPAALSDAELTQLITQAISETEASSAKDLGKVVAYLKTQVQGRADMRLVTERIKKQLSP